jgi:hypothetical protein
LEQKYIFGYTNGKFGYVIENVKKEFSKNLFFHVRLRFQGGAGVPISGGITQKTGS